MEKIKNQFTLKNLIQFIKLQLAGNILFWGTLVGSFLLHEIFNQSEFVALVIASIVSHALFFVADKEWVFNDTGKNRKSSAEIGRFVLFMGLNFFINLAIVTFVDGYLDTNNLNIAIVQELYQKFDVNLYIAQFVSAAFFTFWTFIGLKYWVFREAQHHASLRIKNVHAGKR